MPPTASLDHRFNPGDKLAGRYRIVTLIGEGAIGEVYEAFDEALAEPLALKTLRAQVASQAVTVIRIACSGLPTYPRGASDESSAGSSATTRASPQILIRCWCA